MQTIPEKLEAVEIKVRKLLHETGQLKRERDFLLKENIELKRELKQYIDKIEGLQHAMNAPKADSIPDKEAFKHKIKELAEEVEACIDMINA